MGFQEVFSESPDRKKKDKSQFSSFLPVFWKLFRNNSTELMKMTFELT